MIQRLLARAGSRPTEPAVGPFSRHFLASFQRWALEQLLREESPFRPAAGGERSVSKTFELADFSHPRVREMARSILDFLGEIDYTAFPYQTRLGPLMNGLAYVKVWEVAYLAAMSGIGRDSRVLIPACGPSYWIPVWHREALGCRVTCFEKNKHYNDFTLDESIYARYGIPFSYQDAGSYHYDTAFEAILSHSSIEHFFGGAARGFIRRSDRYLEKGGVFGCTTQVWNPDCSLIGSEEPERSYIFFSEETANALMRECPGLVSLDGQPFRDHLDWSNPSFFEVDPGTYLYDGEVCRTIAAAFLLRRE